METTEQKAPQQILPHYQSKMQIHWTHKILQIAVTAPVCMWCLLKHNKKQLNQALCTQNMCFFFWSSLLIVVQDNPHGVSVIVKHLSIILVKV